MSDLQPVPIKSWIPVQSLLLASRRANHQDVIESFFVNEPTAADVPHMRERLERECLCLRLPPRRPRVMPIFANAMRTALATAPISIVALTLAGRAFEPRWTGEGWGLPFATSLAVTCVATVAAIAVGLQVAADWSRLHHEDQSETAFIAYQLTQLFQRANEFLTTQKS